MTKTFTQTDLIRYLYHEMTEEEKREINKALLCDAELRQHYNALVTMKMQMDDALLEPSEETVENILNYSKAAAAVKS